MKDFFRKEIKVGDKVAYIEKGIQIQTVVGFEVVKTVEYVLLTEEGAECPECILMTKKGACQLGGRPHFYEKREASKCFIV